MALKTRRDLDAINPVLRAEVLIAIGSVLSEQRGTDEVAATPDEAVEYIKDMNGQRRKALFRLARDVVISRERETAINDISDVAEALRSSDPKQQIYAAMRASRQGIVYVDELLKVLVATKREDVKAEVVNALDLIARDMGLGPGTFHAVPILISFLQDPRQSMEDKIQIASVLGNCAYDVFPNKLAVLRQVFEALEAIGTPDPDDDFKLTILEDVHNKLTAIMEGRWPTPPRRP
jgi:hypothetical protein